MFRKFIAVFVLMFFVASINCPTVSAFKPGEIYRATGFGVSPKNFDANDSFAKTYARQIARMDALRYIAEDIGGVIIETDKEHVNHVTLRVAHDSKFFELLKRHTRQVGEAKFTPIDDGFKCEVTMELIIPADWKE